MKSLGMTGDEDCDCANPSPTPLGKIAAEPLQPHLDLVRREPVKNRRKLSRPAFRVLDPRGPDLRAETPAGGVRAYSARVRARKRGRKSALLSVFVL